MNSEIRNILKTCSTCKETFSSLRELIAHEQRHQKRPESNSNPVETFPAFARPVWNRNGKSSSSLSSNGKSSDAISAIKCALSGDASRSYCSIKSALDGNSPKSGSVETESAHSKSSIQCEYCPSRAKNHIAMVEHFRVYHHNEYIARREENTKQNLLSIYKYRCQFCSVTSSFVSSLLKHLRLRHHDVSWYWEHLKKISLVLGSDSPEQWTTRNFQEELVANSQSISRRYVVSGAANNTRPRWVCEFCYGLFLSRDGFVLHQKYQHFVNDVSPMSYFCSICSSTEYRNYMDDKEKFLEHMSTQHGITIEEDIDQQTADNDSTTSSGHSNSFPPLPQKLHCTKRRYWHRENWRCDYCLKVFEFLQWLQTHQRSCHKAIDGVGLGRYFCSKCPGKGREKIHFAGKKEFEKHALKYHGIVLDKFGSKKKNKKKTTRKAPIQNETTATSTSEHQSMEIKIEPLVLENGTIDRHQQSETAWTTVVKEEPTDLVKQEPIHSIKQEPEESIFTNIPIDQTGSSKSLGGILDFGGQSESAWNVVLKEEPI